jgi:hypothetical protein
MSCPADAGFFERVQHVSYVWMQWCKEEDRGQAEIEQQEQSQVKEEVA